MNGSIDFIGSLTGSIDGGGGGETYTAGQNIQISDDNVISATDTTYTAGDNVQISNQNVISATNTTYTAGDNVQISPQNVISATDTNTDALSELTDVSISNPSNNQVLKYNSTSQKWENGTGGSAGTTKTVIYTSSSRENTIQLTDAYTNYDFILISANSASYIFSTLYCTDDLSAGRKIGVSDDADYLWYDITDSDTLDFRSAHGNYFIEKIYGIKL